MGRPAQSLRAARRAKLLTIRGLAERAACSKSTILEIEQGRRLPSLKTVERLARALGVEPVEVNEFGAALHLGE
jgi:transcriptional regulator with XRE-family HTH domain